VSQDRWAKIALALVVVAMFGAVLGAATVQGPGSVILGAIIAPVAATPLWRAWLWWRRTVVRRRMRRLFAE
jgi:hypothetical protein